MKPIDAKHIDSHLHVRGESQYVDDVPPPPDMLHAAVFGSPKAHGIITRLATGAARAAPGVVAVLTAGDIPGVNRFGPIFEDEQLLVEREVTPTSTCAAKRSTWTTCPHRPRCCTPRCSAASSATPSPSWWPAARIKHGRRAS